jgi:hypothetical protein
VEPGGTSAIGMLALLPHLTIGLNRVLWDDERRDCGAVLFLPDKTGPYSRIKSLIEKLVADESCEDYTQGSCSFRWRPLLDLPCLPGRNLCMRIRSLP